MRKLIVYTILSSMILHCGFRLGFLDQLYQKRHEIALTIGLIAEIPIAICNGDYDFGKRLKIESHEDAHSVPQSPTQTQEINLFFISEYQLSDPPTVLLSDKLMLYHTDLYSLTGSTSIFRPPAV